jgi:nitrogen-specific signal transduction histidine kinase
MFQSGSAGEQVGSETFAEGDPMTLARLRHDIRNHLNAIKLCTALLQRQRLEKSGADSLREIDKSVEKINELVGRFMGDADAPGLFQPSPDHASTGK